MQSVYRKIIQDICKRERFWWRRVLVNFSLTVGQSTYDLTNSTLFPSLVGVAIEEITKFTLILAPNPLQVAELVPVFDPEALIDMVNNFQLTSPAAGTANGQTAGGRYTMDANSFSVLRIDPPDQAYNAFIVGWGMPNPASETTDDTVKLIPPWGHNTIVDGMCARIFRFAYGSKNEKTIDSAAEYEQGIIDLEQKKKFDPNFRLQMSLSEHAVRST